MDKKQYVLKMLEELQNIWPLARWLKILAEANEINNDVMDILINTFQEASKNIEDETSKQKLQQASLFLQELKQRELDDQKNDEQDISKIEELLKEI